MRPMRSLELVASARGAMDLPVLPRDGLVLAEGNVRLMLRPKRLFKRDRVTEEHEAVPITLQLGGLPFDPARHIVHVPVARFVELDCDHCLRGLEALGVRVDRSKGSEQLSTLHAISAATDAVRDGFDSVLFIDSDILFDPADAVKLFQSPEPVIAGVYAAKKLGNGQLNVHFEEGVDQVRIGPWATEPYPVQKVGAGFLRIKTDVLRQMVKDLKLPYCRMAAGTAGRSSSRRSSSRTARPSTCARTTPSVTDSGRSA